MACPDRVDGIHNIGANSTCSCGYVFRIPPISIGIEVFDRQTELFSDHFNCETIDGAIEGLECAVRALKKLQAQR